MKGCLTSGEDSETVTFVLVPPVIRLEYYALLELKDVQVTKSNYQMKENR